MTFLNPGILLGLFAISIPILIHLLNLRKIRKVEFSTLMFLKEIQKSKMRRIKLKQLLLLLLRVLAIIFLVLSFSNPVYEGLAGNEDKGNTTVLIIIDDSFSMTARDDKGLYLTQAKDAVKKILESHKESDNVYIVSASEIGLKNMSESKTIYDNISELRDSLEKLKPAYKPADITQIMNYTSGIFGKSKDRNKELYVISDFQKNNFDNERTDFFKDLADYPVNVFLVKTGNRNVSNLSLDSFSIETKIIEKDKETKVKIYVNNHSQFNVKNIPVNLFIDNELKNEKAVDIGSFEKTEIEFSFKPGKSGYLSGKIELVQKDFGEDEFIQDNNYYFTIYIPEKFNIGILENSSSDYKFIELAVRSASQILSDSIKKESGLFAINSFSSVDKDIFSNEIIFISGKNSFTENEATIIKEYISGGGGVFMFPGIAADLNNYNNVLLSGMNSVKFGSINSDENINRALKLEKINFNSPLLDGVFSNKDLSETSDRFNIESPSVRSFYELISNESSNTIITFSNERPFLIESKLSAGKIIISSLPLSAEFSDLASKSIFLPLILRSIYYLSNNFSIQNEYTVGRSNLLTLNKKVNITGLILPDKDSVDLNINSDNELPGNLKVNSNYFYLPYINETKKAGFYELADSSGSKYLFALNADSKESNPDSYKEDEILKYFKGPGIKTVRFIDDNDNITSEIRTADTGLSLWKYFLIGAVLLILGEMLYSKRIEKS